MASLNEKVVRNKLGLLKLAEELSNVSKACQVMGVSRDTFYRYKEAHESGSVAALFEKSRRKPNVKNRVEAATETAVKEYAIEQPAHGQVRSSIKVLISCRPAPSVRNACLRTGRVFDVDLDSRP